MKPFVLFRESSVYLCRILVDDLHQVLAALEERLGGGVSFQVGLEPT